MVRAKEHLLKLDARETFGTLLNRNRFAVREIELLGGIFLNFLFQCFRTSPFLFIIIDVWVAFCLFFHNRG